MGDGAFGAPADGVALGLGDEEGGAAALIAVSVDTLLDGEVEDLAFGHCRCCLAREGVSFDDDVFGRVFRELTYVRSMCRLVPGRQ